MLPDLPELQKQVEHLIKRFHDPNLYKGTRPIVMSFSKKRFVDKINQAYGLHLDEAGLSKAAARAVSGPDESERFQEIINKYAMPLGYRANIELDRNRTFYLFSIIEDERFKGLDNLGGALDL